MKSNVLTMSSQIVHHSALSVRRLYQGVTIVGGAPLSKRQWKKQLKKQRTKQLKTEKKAAEKQERKTLQEVKRREMDFIVEQMTEEEREELRQKARILGQVCPFFHAH